MSELKTMNKVLSPEEVYAMRDTNRITYPMPDGADISKHSTFAVDFANSGGTATNNQQIIFEVGAVGTAFVDFRRSWLQFQLTGVQNTGGTQMDDLSFGAMGSAHNLISEIMIQKGSQVIGRLQNANLFNNRKAFLTKPRDWFQTVGPMSGFGPLDYTTATHPIPQAVLIPCLAGGVSISKYVLPLQDILGFFDQEKLVPGLLAGSLRISITLAQPSIAFASGKNGTDYANRYVIQNAEVHWRIIEVADEFTRAVSIASASEGGLSLTHEETYFTSGTSATSTFTTDIKHNVGSAMSLMVVPRLTTNLLVGTDSMACAPFDYREVRLHVGNDYFPTQPLRGSTVSDFSEFYANEMDAYGSLKHSIGTPSVPYGSLIYDYGYAGGYSLATSTTDLTKNDATKWAGYWITANNALSLNYQFWSAQNRDISMFLSHMRILKIFPSQVVIME